METSIIKESVPLDKRGIDWEKGDKKTNEVVAYINQFFSNGFYLRRVHDYTKTMTGWERVKFNKIMNRHFSASLSNGMGLDCIMTHSQKENRQLIRFGYIDKTGFYLKIPKEYKEDWKTYLDFLSKINYRVIIAHKRRNRWYFSHPIHINIFIEGWNPQKQESKDNKNRIQFHGKLSKIICIHPTQENLEGKSLIKELQNLVK